MPGPGEPILRKVESTAPAVETTLREWYIGASAWSEQHLHTVGMMVAASLIALYGRDITGLLSRRMARWPFPVRAAVFVVVAGMGFGALTAAAAPLLATAFAVAGRNYIIPITVAAFIIVGILAERSRRI